VRMSQTLTSKMLFHFVFLTILFIVHTLCCFTTVRSGYCMTHILTLSPCLVRHSKQKIKRIIPETAKEKRSLRSGFWESLQHMKGHINNIHKCIIQLITKIHYYSRILTKVIKQRRAVRCMTPSHVLLIWIGHRKW
jgi:hypothetical protein